MLSLQQSYGNLVIYSTIIYNTETIRKPLTQFEVDPFDITLKLVYSNVRNNNFT